MTNEQETPMTKEQLAEIEERAGRAYDDALVFVDVNDLLREVRRLKHENTMLKRDIASLESKCLTLFLEK